MVGTVRTCWLANAMFLAKGQGFFGALSTFCVGTRHVCAITAAARGEIIDAFCFLGVPERAACAVVVAGLRSGCVQKLLSTKLGLDDTASRLGGPFGSTCDQHKHGCVLPLGRHACKLPPRQTQCRVPCQVSIWVEAARNFAKVK